MVLPGRNPVLVAKELASLDRLSRGRLLPAFGLGVADVHEQQAFGVARGERAAWFDEALPLIRRLWTEDTVDHDGPRFHYEGVRVLPKPTQQPPDVWLGGIAPSELRRVGRLADGWLPSFVHPDDVAGGRKVVEETAAAHDRAIDPEHFGVLVPYASGRCPRPSWPRSGSGGADLADPSVLVRPAWRRCASASRRSSRSTSRSSWCCPIAEPDPDAVPDHLAWLADELLDLQN